MSPRCFCKNSFLDIIDCTGKPTIMSCALSFSFFFLSYLTAFLLFHSPSLPSFLLSPPPPFSFSSFSFCPSFTPSSSSSSPSPPLPPPPAFFSCYIPLPLIAKQRQIRQYKNSDFLYYYKRETYQRKQSKLKQHDLLLREEVRLIPIMLRLSAVVISLALFKF